MTTAELNSYEQMLVKKTEIERELADLGQILAMESNIGMHGPLIDAEGYPRADIDIYKVRVTRQKINCLQNDYTALLNRIEKELESIHELSRDNKQQMPRISVNNTTTTAHKPFIRLDQVDAGSPAFESGLKKNDLVIQFGPCTRANTKSDLSDVASLVRESKDKIILVKICRKERKAEGGGKEGEEEEEKIMIKKLVPKLWSGNGLLGCKLVKI